MRDFDYGKLKDRTWDNEIVSVLARIYEYKGKQDCYVRQKPQELKRLTEIAIRQSTESSNQIEGIVTTSSRLKQLLADKTTPRNRDEKEILGYRNVLDLIHNQYAYIPLRPNYILQLHRDLLKYTGLSYGGSFKTTANEIDQILADGTRHVLFRPLEPYETPAAVEAICDSYRETLAKESVDPLLLIPAFLLDFLCIHPFNDGNGRMSRLLTLLLLYQSGFTVGKYISIEKAIADTKEEYYDALFRSDREWHEGGNDPKHFIRYMLQIILECYRQFEERCATVTRSGVRSSSYDIVKAYVSRTIGLFSKQDVLIACPALGSSSVEAALKKLVEEGLLMRLGAGRRTHYVRSDALPQ